jgi:peptidoglycan hydrolase-like protein with peptidoglycan-binding domain
MASADQSSPPPAKKTSHHAAAATPASNHKGSHKKSKKIASGRRRGQQKIDSGRARQIQAALVREHYLSGSPSGVWDDNTQKAMQKFQADHGWQSKTTPDARALIKLGLGPDHDHLLNPDSAMTTPPDSMHSVSSRPSKSPADPESSSVPQ